MVNFSDLEEELLGGNGNDVTIPSCSICQRATLPTYSLNCDRHTFCESCCEAHFIHVCQENYFCPWCTPRPPSLPDRACCWQVAPTETCRLPQDSGASQGEWHGVVDGPAARGTISLSSISTPREEQKGNLASTMIIFCK